MIALKLCVLVTVVAATFLWPNAGQVAAAGNSITTPDTDGNVGRYNSLALDKDGNPVIAYHEEIGGQPRHLKVLHCGDPTCTSGNSITTPDPSVSTRSYPSLALDAKGNPVISYVAGDLRVLHCGNPNCTAGNSIAAPDTAFGEVTSLVLDASGNPVVSYRGSGLTVLHCGNPNCTAGNSISTPDTALGETGAHSSLALDVSGNPVVSYHHGGGPDLDDLRVMHCNDPDCSGGGESFTSPDTAGRVGDFTSLALDSSGNPVVSYRLGFGPSGKLKVMHCNDPNCSGDDESITVPDNLSSRTSLRLDSSGNPVVSYLVGTDHGIGLRVLHCGDPTCTIANTIAAPDTEGRPDMSLVLDASGNPVVSYHDFPNLDLKVLHCGDPACKAPPPVGGIAELPAVAGTALEVESSGVGAGVVGGVVAAVAAGAVALGGAAWYARRRRSR